MLQLWSPSSVRCMEIATKRLLILQRSMLVRCGPFRGEWGVLFYWKSAIVRLTQTSRDTASSSSSFILYLNELSTLPKDSPSSVLPLRMGSDEASPTGG